MSHYMIPLLFGDSPQDRTEPFGSSNHCFHQVSLRVKYSGADASFPLGRPTYFQRARPAHSMNSNLEPHPGIEPGTQKLTASRSATELMRLSLKMKYRNRTYLAGPGYGSTSLHH